MLRRALIKLISCIRTNLKNQKYESVQRYQELKLM